MKKKHFACPSCGTLLRDGKFNALQEWIFEVAEEAYGDEPEIVSSSLVESTTDLHSFYCETCSAEFEEFDIVIIEE